MHRTGPRSLLGVSSYGSEISPLGSQSHSFEGVAHSVSWFFDCCDCISYSYSSTELDAVGNSKVVVSWASVSRWWGNGSPESGILGSSIFSSRANDIVSQRWAVLTNFLNRCIGSNGRSVDFVYFCSSLSSAISSGSVAMLGRETSEVQNGFRHLLT